MSKKEGCCQAGEGRMGNEAQQTCMCFAEKRRASRCLRPQGGGHPPGRWAASVLLKGQPPSSLPKVHKDMYGTDSYSRGDGIEIK